MNRENLAYRVARRAYRETRNLKSYLQWRAFRWRNASTDVSAPGTITEEERVQLDAKEQHLQRCLFGLRPQRFLEIGIGGYPCIERLRKLREVGIAYSGCDFEEVCRIHQAALSRNGMNAADFRFLSNKVGTYSWTLMELVNKGEKFDLIYLDGHHTFYVDLPAAFLAHFLLPPGGYLFLDDIDWTLESLRNNMYRFYGEWALYRKAYDFSEYDQEQQRQDHIRMIAESVMIGQLGYLKDTERSLEGWWVLKKPL
jgi:predicted O-methyltransferase YrrM